MTDIAAFIRARLDEDEAVANACRGRNWAVRTHLADRGIVRSGMDTVVFDEGEPTEEEAAHIARHDPARVLAEVAAKRRIVERARNDEDQLSDFVFHVVRPLDSEDWTSGAEWALDFTLRALASPYADHPDYNPAWAIDTGTPWG